MKEVKNPIQILANHIQDANLWHTKKELTRGEFLKVCGAKDTKLYYIEEGSLRIFFQDEYEEHTIRLGYRGNFIASLDSFISEQPSELYIQAIKKCQLKVITKEDFMRLVRSDEYLFNIWLKLLEQMIYQQLEREKDLLTFSPLERYKRVWKRSPQLFQEIPNKYIASYLRMTPETLSRIKKG